MKKIKLKDKRLQEDIGGSEEGANQSNAGTLGLSQPERKQRFEEGVDPHSELDLKQSVTSMRGDAEPDYIEPHDVEFEDEDEPGDEIG
jgi:hypothetical protein